MIDNEILDLIFKKNKVISSDLIHPSMICIAGRDDFHHHFNKPAMDWAGMLYITDEVHCHIGVFRNPFRPSEVNPLPHHWDIELLKADWIEPLKKEENPIWSGFGVKENVMEKRLEKYKEKPLLHEILLQNVKK
jgi:hypothetical protein